MKIDTKEFDRLMKELKKVPEQSVVKAGAFFKDKTPIRTGNARSKTKTEVRRTRINADYPYAGRLDEGWSKQAPKGMSDPTIAYLEQVIDEMVGRL